jgi:peptide-methionine (S)-S-oxide reductase
VERLTTFPLEIITTMANIQSITLGGGCFWCLEAVYERVQGVTAVESGYSNGHVPNPTYEQVCGGDTGHVEVVKVTFDADVIPLTEVLEIFFHIHDPTTKNRQGNDVGTQYRSGIYFEGAEQERVAREVWAQANAEHKGKVVTEVVPLLNYTKGEAYHQHYFARNPGAGYCAFVVAPKVEKFKRTFAARVKAAAA